MVWDDLNPEPTEDWIQKHSQKVEKMRSGADETSENLLPSENNQSSWMCQF